MTVDISDSESVAAAVEEVGEIDGLVFLAGLATLLKAQDWDTDRVEQMFDVNLTGGRAGHRPGDPSDGGPRRGAYRDDRIAFGYRGLPESIGYSASKAGLMALAESMHRRSGGTRA